MRRIERRQKRWRKTAAARAEVARGQAVVLDAVGAEGHELGGFQLAGVAGGGGFDDLILQLFVLQVVKGDGGQEVQGQAGWAGSAWTGS